MAQLQICSGCFCWCLNLASYLSADCSNLALIHAGLSHHICQRASCQILHHHPQLISYQVTKNQVRVKEQRRNTVCSFVVLQQTVDCFDSFRPASCWLKLTEKAQNATLVLWKSHERCRNVMQSELTNEIYIYFQKWTFIWASRWQHCTFG